MTSPTPPADWFRTGRNRRHLNTPSPHDEFTLAPDMSAAGDLPVGDAVTRVLTAWSTGTVAAAFSEASYARYEHNLLRFTRFTTAVRLERLADVTAETCADWIHSRLSGPRNRRSPANGDTAYGTQASRRTTLINFFTTCWRLGLHNANPAEQVTTLGRSARRVRPLTEAEVKCCQDQAAYRTREDLIPAVLAIALTGSTVTELAQVRVRDVRLDARMLYLPGLGQRYTPRWVPLDDWQTRALTTRIDRLRRSHPGRALAAASMTMRSDPSTSTTQQLALAANRQMTTALRKGGLTVDDGVRPASFMEYVARRVYAETGQVEAVAVRCGFKSLDAAARLIDVDWRARFAMTPPTASGT